MTDVLTSVSPLRGSFQHRSRRPERGKLETFIRPVAGGVGVLTKNHVYLRPPSAPELHTTNRQPQPSFTENFHAMVTRSPPNVRCGCVLLLNVSLCIARGVIREHTCCSDKSRLFATRVLTADPTWHCRPSCIASRCGFGKTARLISRACAASRFVSCLCAEPECGVTIGGVLQHAARDVGGGRRGENGGRTRGRNVCN